MDYRSQAHKMNNYVKILTATSLFLASVSCQPIDNSELAAIHCSDAPPPPAPSSDSDCSQNNGTESTRYFYSSKAGSCIPVSLCSKGSTEDLSKGFGSNVECQNECEKRRQPRSKISPDSKYSVLTDFEITAPKKLSKATRRRFPLALCDLEWDSGLICPGIKRGSYLDQFHYDSKTNTCEHFVYNGCGGNANRFFSIWECVQSCVKKGHSQHY